MADFDNDNLVVYKCLNPAEGTGHGGGIDLSNPVTDNTKNNLFDDVSSSDLAAGEVDARKMFIRNEDDDIYPDPKVWIDTQTPGTADSVAIRIGGTKGKWGVAVKLSGTGVFVNGQNYVWTDTDVRGEILPGELVYNGTDDDESYALVVTSVTVDRIYMVSNYGGTTGGGVDVMVARVQLAEFYQPDSKVHADVQAPGTMAVNGSFALWVRRTVQAGGQPISGNSYKIAMEFS